MKRLKAIFAACVAGVSASGCASLAAVDPSQQPAAIVQQFTPQDEAVRQEALEHANMLMRPYKEGSTDWQLVATSQDLIGKTRSGFDGAVFRSGDHYAVAFYGYNHINDLNEVIKAGFMGVPRHQLRDAEAFTEKAAATYGVKPAEMEFLGHSLGGYLAKAVGSHYGAEEIWAFNSPGFKQRDPGRFERVLGPDEKSGEATRIYNVNSKEDVVGRWGYQPGQVFEVDTPDKHHTMGEMAAALRRLDPNATPEAAAEPEKKGFMQRMFNRVAHSDFVQKRLLFKFRNPERPPNFN